MKKYKEFTTHHFLKVPKPKTFAVKDFYKATNGVISFENVHRCMLSHKGMDVYTFFNEFNAKMALIEQKRAVMGYSLEEAASSFHSKHGGLVHGHGRPGINSDFTDFSENFRNEIKIRLPQDDNKESFWGVKDIEELIKFYKMENDPKASIILDASLLQEKTYQEGLAVIKDNDALRSHLDSGRLKIIRSSSIQDNEGLVEYLIDVTKKK